MDKLIEKEVEFPVTDNTHRGFVIRLKQDVPKWNAVAGDVFSVTSERWRISPGYQIFSFPSGPTTKKNFLSGSAESILDKVEFLDSIGWPKQNQNA